MVGVAARVIGWVAFYSCISPIFFPFYFVNESYRRSLKLPCISIRHGRPDIMIWDSAVGVGCIQIFDKQKR